MRSITVTKDAFGLCFKEHGSNWNRFPDGITTPQQIENFFTQNGKYDKPQVIFSGDKTGNKKLYQVTRIDNKVSALVDFQKTLIFEPEQFMSVSDQIEFLQTRSNRETEKEADQLTTDKEKHSFYLENADPEIISELRTRISERMSETRIKELCQAHAKEYFNKEAIVEFG